MPNLTRFRTPGSLALALVAAALAIGWPAPTLAAEVRTGSTAQVAADESISDDVYLFGNNVVVQGTVNGDVFAAGSTVTVNGHITGDLFAAGTNVSVSGPVDGSVRSAGTLVTVGAPVAHDLLAAGSNIALNSPGSVGRDVLAAGATINLLAPIGGDVKASGSTLTIGSTVGGSVQAEVNDLALTSAAQVAGPVAHIPPRQAAPANPWQVGAFDTLAFVRGFVGLFALGALLALVGPRAATTTAATVERHWLASLGVGFALLVAVPFVALIVFLIGLAIGGWWIALMLLALYAMLLVVGYLAAAEWLGVAIAHRAGWRMHPVWSLAIGLFIVNALAAVPWVGGLIGLLAIVIGTGALAMAGWAAHTWSTTSASTPAESQPVPRLAPAV